MLQFQPCSQIAFDSSQFVTSTERIQSLGTRILNPACINEVGKRLIVYCRTGSGKVHEWPQPSDCLLVCALPIRKQCPPGKPNHHSTVHEAPTPFTPHSVPGCGCRSSTTKHIHSRWKSATMERYLRARLSILKFLVDNYNRRRLHFHRLSA